MAVLFGVALGLIVCGIFMCWKSDALRKEPLVTITYWVGVVLAIVGLVLLLTPVLVWLNLQLRSAFNL